MNEKYDSKFHSGGGVARSAGVVKWGEHYMKEYKPEYTINKIYKDTYAITDNGFSQGKVYMYLLVGNEKALLVDSGYGMLDLKAVIKTITDKPVICICTHGHLDHAPGACQFDESYLHSKDFDVFKQHTDPELITKAGLKGLMMKPPIWMRNNPSYHKLVETMASKKYTAPQPLDDAESFDLGGRTVTWRHVPGHTQGSIAVIDETYKTAFDADACAPGAWLFLPESSSLTEYKKELESYLVFLENTKIERRYVGHAGKALGTESLQKLIKCVQVAIDKPKKGIKVKTILGNARIVFAAGSLLFC